MIFPRNGNSLRFLQYGLFISERILNPQKICSRKLSYRQNIPRETLVYRFYKFFEKNPKYARYVVNDTGISCGSLRGNQVFKGEGSTLDVLEKLTLTELQQFIVYLSNKYSSYKSTEFKRAVRDIDQVCYGKMDSTSVEDTLKFNYAWLYLLGSNMTNLRCFHLSLYNLKTFLISENLSAKAIILTLFYAGFDKKNLEVLQIIPVALAQLCKEETLNELSTLEMMLVANVAFKTDPALFVTLVKSMRQNKHLDYALLKNIKKCISGNKKILSQYNLTAKVHLLALYADALYGDREFISYIINSAARNLLQSGSYRPYKEMAEDSIAGRVRAKDLARLLWASSYLGFKIDPEIVEKEIMPIILYKASNGFYEKKLEVLIDSVLSLWIMGYKPVELIPYIFSEETTKFLSESKRVRYNFRFQLLFTCISIEVPELLKDIPSKYWSILTRPYAEEKDTLKSRPNLLDVLLVVKSIAWRYDVVEIKCGTTLPSLNLPGILLKTDCHNSGYLYIEVLDESNCLYNTDIPNGLMLLKLRLLRLLGHHVILVNYKEYQDNHSSLISFLEDELNKLG